MRLPGAPGKEGEFDRRIGLGIPWSKNWAFCPGRLSVPVILGGKKIRIGYHQTIRRPGRVGEMVYVLFG